MLINRVCRLVIPIGCSAQLRGNTWQHHAFLLFQEKCLHDGIQTSCSTRKNRGRAGGRNRKQIRIAHTIGRNLSPQLIPLCTNILTLFKVCTRLPVRTLKQSIRTTLGSQIARSFNGKAIDLLKQLIYKREVLLTLPANSALSQHMMVAAHAQTNGAVTMVGNLGVRQSVKVEVNDVVQSADHRMRKLTQMRGVLKINVAQRQTC